MHTILFTDPTLSESTTGQPTVSQLFLDVPRLTPMTARASLARRLVRPWYGEHVQTKVIVQPLHPNLPCIGAVHVAVFAADEATATTTHSRDSRGVKSSLESLGLHADVVCLVRASNRF